MKLLKASNEEVKNVSFHEKMFGGLSFSLHTGLLASMDYSEKDVASATEISEENYRSAGGAAVGAIIGGALTGGIGLLLGGAFGGRKKYASIFAIKFKDGNGVVVQTQNKKEAKSLRILAATKTFDAEV
ncbi:MAG: hypothetical protein MPK31_08535 [Gammaproteobacteria bacterium]|nr:hypothetical protein [Gammaproteobacteria bacterium]